MSSTAVPTEELATSAADDPHEFNEGHILEAGDRAHTITVMLEELLGRTPSYRCSGA